MNPDDWKPFSVCQAGKCLLSLLGIYERHKLGLCNNLTPEVGFSETSIGKPEILTLLNFHQIEIGNKVLVSWGKKYPKQFGGGGIIPLEYNLPLIDPRCYLLQNPNRRREFPLKSRNLEKIEQSQIHFGMMSNNFQRSCSHDWRY